MPCAWKQATRPTLARTPPHVPAGTALGLGRRAGTRPRPASAAPGSRHRDPRDREPRHSPPGQTSRPNAAAGRRLSRHLHLAARRYVAAASNCRARLGAPRTHPPVTALARAARRARGRSRKSRQLAHPRHVVTRCGQLGLSLSLVERRATPASTTPERCSSSASAHAAARSSVVAPAASGRSCAAMFVPGREVERLPPTALGQATRRWRPTAENMGASL